MTVSVGGDEGPGVLRVFSCVNLYEVMGLVRLWLWSLVVLG